MSKRIAIIALALALLFSLTACAGANSSGGGGAATSSPNPNPPNGNMPDAPDKDDLDDQDDSIWPDNYTVTIDIGDMTFTGSFFKESETPEGKPVYRILFEDAKSQPMSYTLFGVEYTEIWTLNMSMERFQSDSPYKIDGSYEGKYIIVIDYDLNELPNDFLNIGPAGNTWNEVSAPFYSSEATLEITPEMNSVWRTIEGDAKAFLWRDPVDGTCSITPWENKNDKDVLFSFNASVTGIATQGPAKVTTRADYLVTSDDYQINVLLTGNHTVIEGGGVSTTVTDVDLGADTTVAWSEAGNIWERGDNASSFWKITLTPLS
jgi:major membrane immunogen (membrane-anchored lipoprotein)